MTQAVAGDDVRLPRVGGQLTKQQRPDDAVSGIFTIADRDHGYGKPDAGTFETYRRMRDNPTAALARMIATGPIRGSEWSVEIDDGVPEGIAEEVEAEFFPHRAGIIEDAMRALEYGFQAWELVWQVAVRPYGQRLVIDKYKSLLQDKTDPLIDDKGTYRGLENAGILLAPENTLWYTHDRECDNWYGRSRYENYRVKAQKPWEELQNQQGIYAKRVACPILIVHYPMGKSKNESGAEVDNFDLAKQLVQSVARARYACIPNQLMREAIPLLREGAKIADMRQWILEWLEVSTSHGGEYVEMMRHYESMIFRAWLVPERAGLEGQYGTKAEAVAHSDIALIAAELTQQEMMRAVNRYAVDRYVTLNHGARYKGMVRLVGKPIDDVSATLHSEIIKKVLGENPDIFEGAIDTEGLYERFKLPAREGPPERAVMPTPEELKAGAERVGAAAVGKESEGE